MKGRLPKSYLADLSAQKIKDLSLSPNFSARQIAIAFFLISHYICDAHMPLTGETEKMIGKKELELMKASAYLINIARGKIIDEEALIEALQNKTIAGAALDVFEKEPIDLNNPLLSLPNVVVAPHIAGSTVETRSEMSVIAAHNILNALQGKPTNVVNREVLKL